MPISRRWFLAEAAAAGLLPSLLPTEVAAQVAQHSAQPSSGPPTAGESYWSNLYKPAGQRGGHSAFGDELRNPRFAYFDGKKGLRWAEDNKRDNLPSFNDSAVVTLELGGFRAGALDEPKLGKVRFAQMHLSCQQVRGIDFIGPLAWAALATVFADKTSRLPAVQDMNFSPQQPGQTMPGAPQLNRVLLPEGAGHLSVNITTTPVTSMLDKILSTTLKAAKILTPLFGFPAISVPALSAFTAFYGSLEKAGAGNFLLATALRDVAVTQNGSGDANVSSKAMNLISGDYILVPEAQTKLLEAQMDDLVVQNGYLIQRKDAGSTLSVDERVKGAVPDLTYVTLHADVRAASAFNQNPTHAAIAAGSPVAGGM
jgi:hypothetical protein